MTGPRSRLILQDAGQPSTVYSALSTYARPSTTGVRLAVAYTTLSGYEVLRDMLENRLGPTAWKGAAKELITSFDFYITEPRALRRAKNDRFTLARGIAAGNRAFHPKLYVLDDPRETVVVVGSPNLTSPALIDNTEMAIILRLRPGSSELLRLNEHWRTLQGAAMPLADPDIDAYEIDRKRRAPRHRPSPRVPRRGGPQGVARRTASGLPVFPDEVAAGNIDPARFKRFWLEAGAMSSSDSHNQLELPRFSNYFFGFRFNRHAATIRQHVIGQVPLYLGSKRHANRELQWRGAGKLNKMERLYLPTEFRGGVPYRGTGILFERRRAGFSVTVAAWGSAMAKGWRRASDSAGTIYRLGRSSPRQCGFF